MDWLNALQPLILTVHYILCIFMTVVILLQAGKGADIGAAFGAGSSQTLFGPRGAATLLSKLTTVVAMLFLVTSVSLATIHRNRAAELNADEGSLQSAPVEIPPADSEPSPQPENQP